jgi:hypothetical protein
MTLCLSGRVAARALRAKFDQILPHFDERRRRLYLASEATALGRGGIVRVAAASGTSTATIARGMAELAGCSSPTLRVRAPGAGRKRLTDTDPGLLPALESLIEPHTRGDPVSPLRWTTLSLRALASTLTAQGHSISASTVGHLLHTQGYSLQGTAKTTEGISHPDRDAQFTHLNATAAAFLNDAQPVISVDTKAKEWLGNRDRPGRTWQPGKNAIKVDCHTFTTNDQPMAIPYGIYDIANNSGWVNVGRPGPEVVRGRPAPRAHRTARARARGRTPRLDDRGTGFTVQGQFCQLTSNPVALPSNRVVPHPACPEPRNERGPTASRRSSGQLSHSTARPAAHQPPRVPMHVMHRLVACSCAFPPVAMAGLLALIRSQSPGDGSRIQPHFGGRTSSSAM